MKQGRTRWLLVGVVCLTLWGAGCTTQETRWDSVMADAVKAYQQADYPEAEKLFLAALKEAEKFGEQDLRLATSLNNLALLYSAQGRYAQAESLNQRALGIQEKALGPEHPQVATLLENYAALLHKLNRDAQADKIEARAQAIRAKHAQENPQRLELPIPPPPHELPGVGPLR